MTTQETIKHLTELVAIPSTAGNPHAVVQAVQYMADFISTRADVTFEWFEVDGKPSFLAYRGAARPEKFTVLLNAHVDVVSAPPEMFVVRHEGDRLYGRGVLDMKGTALVLADLFCELVDVVDYPLGLQIVGDEEISGPSTLHLVTEGVRSEIAFTAEYANDPGMIYNAARGMHWIEVAFRGKSAHGGHPWHGDNAVVRAARFTQKLAERFPVPSAETWTTTANIASIETPNTTYNKVPDYATVRIDFRFTEKDTLFGDEQALRAFVAELDPNAEIIEMTGYGPAVFVPQENPLVQALAASIREVTGAEARYKGRPASSDGRHFARVGVPCLEFGLVGQGAHSDTEFLEVASLEQYRRIMAAFLKNPKRA